jgi:predicted Zn-dependent protease
MIRIPNDYLGSELIAIRNWVLCTLPGGIRDRLENTDFFVGDPIYAGLHGSIESFDGRSYRSTGHFLGIVHQDRLPTSRRRPTVVLPTFEDLNYWTVRHELGHALHEALLYDWDADPITEYAKNDRYEAFAEAFCAYDWPAYADRSLTEFDPATHAYFEKL